MAISGEFRGHIWGILLAISGEFYWPYLGNFRGRLWGIYHVRRHNEEALITEYSGPRLRMDLDRVPLWRGNHVTLRQLWSDYCQYLYLPRLRDSKVLLDAVRSAVALLSWTTDTFAYASAYDEEADRYVGLTAGEHASVVLDATSVVVKVEVALHQMEREQAPATEEPSPTNAPVQAGQRGDQDRGATLGPTRGSMRPLLPRRFYGRVRLEPLRLLRDVGDIVETIVSQLGRTDASMTITFEIEATSEEGFSEDIRRTVDENARTLKFETYEFEDG